MYHVRCFTWWENLIGKFLGLSNEPDETPHDVFYFRNGIRLIHLHSTRLCVSMLGWAGEMCWWILCTYCRLHKECDCRNVFTTFLLCMRTIYDVSKAPGKKAFPKKLTKLRRNFSKNIFQLESKWVLIKLLFTHHQISNFLVERTVVGMFDA